MTTHNDTINQLTNDHTRTMLLLNEAEVAESDYFLSLGASPTMTDPIRDQVDELIAIAAKLTGQIYDARKEDRG